MATKVQESSPCGTVKNIEKLRCSVLFTAVNQKHKCSVFCSGMVFIISSFMGIHRTDNLGLLLLFSTSTRKQVAQRCLVRFSRWSQLRKGREGRKMPAMLCRIREMWRDNVLLMRHENLRKPKKNLTSLAGEAERKET
jgi:hypothetical protein